jgi:pimeloyl-ACP methyl ester carboxylesterase
MASSDRPRAPFAVTVHPFPSPTPHSCAYERGPSSARNALVFIGGLTSGPHSTDLDFLANMLEHGSPALSYSLWEFRMRSSYSGFGYSSLANDVEDMAALVQYLRGIGKEKIVLMGASTGACVSAPPFLMTLPDLTSSGRLPGLSRVHGQGQAPDSSGGWLYSAEPGI